MALINRDPFARQELHREVVQKPHSSDCAWCGSDRRLFRYRVETDGGRVFHDNKFFCSIDCRRSYYS